MKNFHIFHLLAALAFGTTNSASAHQTKSDASFSFTLPKNWKSSSNKRNENCQFFKMISSSNATEWDLKACNYQGDLEEVLRFTVFAKDGKKWIASGSMDQQPAVWKSDGIDSTFIETKNPPTCGVINKNSGFRAAGGQCYSALVRCKKDYLIIESNGLNMHFSAMKKITRSVIFKECSKTASSITR